MLATVRKIGGSVAILIPREMAARNRLTAGTPVELAQERDGIIVRPPKARVRRSIKDIVREIDASAYASHRGLARDRAVGREPW